MGLAVLGPKNHGTFPCNTELKTSHGVENSSTILPAHGGGRAVSGNPRPVMGSYAPTHRGRGLPSCSELDQSEKRPRADRVG
jgi:hypothetical protein